MQLAHQWSIQLARREDYPILALQIGKQKFLEEAVF